MGSHVVLVTGLPSMLAQAVCAEALRADGAAEVCAVARAVHGKRVNEWRSALPPGDGSRIRLLEGDACAIDLGLSGAEFNSLAQKVTQIHHGAEATNLAVGRGAAEARNVGAAQEALEFASHCVRLERLVFYSTVHVAGDRTGVVAERELAAGQSFRSVMDETKARAEKLVREAMPRLPVTIVRPATLVGDSRTGEVDRFDGAYLLILWAVTSPSDISPPLPGRGDELLHLVPIDWVARAAVALGGDARAIGRTFHLVDPKPLSARRFFELVGPAGGRKAPRSGIPAFLARALLRAPGPFRSAQAPRVLLERLSTSVTYDASNANELLPALGVPPCPPVETYADKLVSYVERGVQSRREARERGETGPPVSDELA